MNFVNAANARNPIDQFETSRVGNLVVNAKLVNMMNSKQTLEDNFFYSISTGSGLYVGACWSGARN
jgi:hypothetical protein